MDGSRPGDKTSSVERASRFSTGYIRTYGKRREEKKEKILNERIIDVIGEISVNREFVYELASATSSSFTTTSRRRRADLAL